MVSGTGHGSHTAGVSRDRCILRSLLHVCGFKFTTSKTNAGSFLFHRSELTIGQIQKLCACLLHLGQFPLGRDLSGDARERLQVLAGVENGAALVASFIEEYHIYYRVTYLIINLKIINLK